MLADRWFCQVKNISLLWANREDIEVYGRYRRAQNGQSHPECRIAVFLEWLSWDAYRVDNPLEERVPAEIAYRPLRELPVSPLRNFLPNDRLARLRRKCIGTTMGERLAQEAGVHPAEIWPEDW